MAYREHNRPLVAFTVLGPASLGCLVGTTFLAGSTEGELALGGTTAALATGAAAVAFSLAHLEKPAAAYRTLLGFPRSPLSREIVAFTVYLSLLGLTWLVELVAAASVWLIGGTSLAGLLAVLASAQIYLLRARPAWRHWSTVASFVATALALGVTTALLLAVPLGEGPAGARSDAALYAVLGGVLLAAAATFSRGRHLRAHAPGALRIGEPFPGRLLALWAMRVIVGLALPTALVIAAFARPELLLPAWAALLAGELLDRWLFFAGAGPIPLAVEIPGARQ
jgi:formate dehydrogenase iron-sulfur subunit